MSTIYQIRDNSNEEFYYDVGFFTSLEGAKEQLTSDNIENLKNAVDGDPNPDYAKYEIHKIELNKISSSYCLCFKISFQNSYDEEKDEEAWDVIF